MKNYILSDIYLASLLCIFSLILIYQVYQLYRLIIKKTLLSKYKTLKKLKCLSWENFERLSIELFKKEGWKVQGNEKKGADGGVDIWMSKKSFTQKNISAIVQCKRYDDTLVTIKVIREMYGLMHEYGVDEAYIVTTSRFTKECYRFTEGKKMILIDGKSLVKRISKVT